MGLDTDPAFVAAVMANPDALDMWAYPILQAEDDFIWARQQDLHQFTPTILEYGEAHADEFGGLFMDNEQGRIMTLWTRDPDRHLAEILALTGRDAPISAKEVRWSQAELRRAQRRIDDEWPGFADARATPTGWGASTSDNVLEVEISSANPDAPRAIAEGLATELGVPVEMLRVVSDGTGVELLGTGWVEGTVVTSDGSRPKGSWQITGDPVTIGYCGGGDIGYGVGRGGSFRIPCKTGDYRMQVWVYRDGHVIVLGESSVVTVREGRTSHTRIRVEP